jgi:hypothetical protein
MAILARLSRLFVAVWASQPLPKGIVNNRSLKNSKMAWGAELAALLKLGICILARSNIVQGSGKKLMSLERSSEFVGEHTGFVGIRKPCVGIKVDIPDLVTKVAIDTFGFDSLERIRINVEWPIGRCHGDMTGAAVAWIVWIIESVPRSVIGLFRIRGKLIKLPVLCESVAC